MENNTVTAEARLVNGSVNYILQEATPKQAIEEYLFPDCRPPVETLLITVKTDTGQTVTIAIGQKSISAFIE